MKKYLAVLFTTSVLMSSCSKDIDFLEVQSDKPDISLLEFGDGEYDAAGHGTDVTIDIATLESTRFPVIDIQRLVEDYPLMVRVIRNDNIETTFNAYFSENAYEYSNEMSQSQNSTKQFTVFKRNISSSFNNTMTSSEKFDGKYIYASQDFNVITKQVWIDERLDILPRYVTTYFTDYINTQTPEHLVRTFGTHVMLNIYVGGKLNLRYQAESRSNERKTASEHGMNWAISGISGMNNSGGATSERATNYNESICLESRGGSVRVAPIKGSIITPPQIDITPWLNSITEQNSQLIDLASPNSLIPIYEFITDPAKKAQVKSYVEQYLEANKTKTEDIQVPLYRYWNSGYMDHYYTTQRSNYAGYIYEGVECNVYNYKAPGSVPIYGYFKRGSRPDHYYTIKRDGVNSDWEPEGIQFFAHSSEIMGSIPIYGYWNQSYIDHFYTRNSGNYGGYVYEGVAWFAFTPSAKESAVHLCGIEN